MYISKSAALALLTVMLLAIGAVGFAAKTEALLKSGEHQAENAGTSQDKEAGAHTMPDGTTMPESGADHAENAGTGQDKVAGTHTMTDGSTMSSGNEKVAGSATDSTSQGAAQKHTNDAKGEGDCSM